MSDFPGARGRTRLGSKFKGHVDEFLLLHVLLQCSSLLDANACDYVCFVGDKAQGECPDLVPQCQSSGKSCRLHPGKNALTSVLVLRT